MKVLATLIAPPHLTASGGVRAGRLLSQALAADCEMTIASMSGVDRARAGKATEAPVQVSLPAPLRALPLKYRSLFYRSDICSLVRRGEWDIVHLHNPMPGLEIARIAKACRTAKVPYVISTHGFNEVANGERIYAFGLARRVVWRTLMVWPVIRAVRGAAAIFVLSPADIPIVRGFGFTGDVIVVPNGVEIPAAHEPDMDRQVYKRLGVAEPDACPGITCMFLGNHTPNKGVPVLLEAFAGLDCPFQLIIAGEKRPEIDYLRYPITRPDQRVIITGRLDDSDVTALLRRADLFVFPTHADTFPLVVLEAMAQGCAVLASAIGGIPHQLDSSCGELIPAGDAGALRAAVARLGANPAQLASMGAAARKRVRSAFTWHAAAASALEGYRRVLRHAATSKLTVIQSSQTLQQEV